MALPKRKPVVPPRTQGRPSAPTSQASESVVEPLPIERLDVTGLCPSFLLMGQSGAGKTHAIGSLLAAGKRVLIIAVEPKLQEIMRYNPLVVQIARPVPLGGGKLRPPTIEEKYGRLMRFKDDLKQGAYRDHEGQPIDIIAIDGLLEVGDIMYSYWKKKRPVSEDTGKQNTFAMWDNIADRAVEFCKDIRDAAGVFSSSLGYRPVGIVCTIGEQMVDAKYGDVRYVPLFPGKKGPTNIPYAFNVVLRLAQRNDGGVYEYVYHTIGSEEFFAKTPPIFEAEIAGGAEDSPVFSEIYDKVMAHYTKGSEG